VSSSRHESKGIGFEGEGVQYITFGPAVIITALIGGGWMTRVYGN
jgi:hypothetical protein